MKRSMKLTLALLGLAMVTGCPLSTDVPLAEPQDGVRDDRLIGTWVGDDDGDSYRLLVVPFNRTEYYAELTGDDEPARLRFYVFAAGDERFLHIEELSTDRDHPEYLFAHYAITDDFGLAVKLVGSELVSEDVEPAALVDFLARNAHDPALYDEEDSLVLHRLEGAD